MRKLRPKEIELLRAFPKPIKLPSGQVFSGGWLLPGQMPKGTHSKTIRNAFKLGLLQVPKCSLVEYYPLELSEAGIKALGESVNLADVLSRGRKVARALRRYRTCERKKAFPTREAAFQKGQESYHCPYCHQWHRSGALAALVAQVKGKR